MIIWNRHSSSVYYLPMLSFWNITKALQNKLQQKDTFCVAHLLVRDAMEELWPCSSATLQPLSVSILTAFPTS